MPLRTLSDADHLPALDRRYALDRPTLGLAAGDPPPRILLLYGSLRERSYERLSAKPTDCGSFAHRRAPEQATIQV